MGHGHVTPNADGSLARCGGHGICSVCSMEFAAKENAKTPHPDAELEKLAKAHCHTAWLNARYGGSCQGAFVSGYQAACEKRDAERLETQCWICPKCADDHPQNAACTPKELIEFLPSPSDKSYIAEQYLKLRADLERERRAREVAGTALEASRRDFARMADMPNWKLSQFQYASEAGDRRIEAALAEIRRILEDK